MTRLRLATNRKTLVIVALLAIATALSWVWWRIGSPLLTTIRNTDVELELRNRIEAPSATPMYKSP